jgi:hypothetical protein
VRLRDVQLSDVGWYVRMRCDPVMTAELGGPLPREGMEAKVDRDVRDVAAGEEDITFAGRVFRANHWVIDPGTDLA